MAGMVTVRSVLLVATDGLYDMVGNERAMKIAFDHWGNPSRAAKQMVAESGKYRRHYWKSRERERERKEDLVRKVESRRERI